ncbi:MAG: Hpt domain-containing protein [Candidatus Micrarchaeota archaeon]
MVSKKVNRGGKGGRKKSVHKKAKDASHSHRISSAHVHHAEKKHHATPPSHHKDTHPKKHEAPREQKHKKGVEFEALHEQIKRQLKSSNDYDGKKSHKKKEVHHKPEKDAKKKQDKKLVVPERPDAVEELKTGEPASEPAVVHETYVEKHGEKDKPTEAIFSLSSFEKSMMDKVDIGNRGDRTEIRISGGFGLNKRVELTSSELSGFLQSLLPEKINSMGPGDRFMVVGFTLDEMNDLLATDIIVEPKGELEVSEEELDGKLCLNIGVIGEGTLFDYSAPQRTTDDVRKVVEREKPWIESKRKEMAGEQETAAPEEMQTGEEDDDWVQKQIQIQHEEVARIAKEMGESIRATLPAEMTAKTAPEAEEKPAEQPAPGAETKPEPAPTTEAEEKPAEQPAPGAETAAPAGEKPADAGGDDEMDMSEFMDVYKEEAVTYVEALNKLPTLKDDPKNAELISEIHRSAHSLKSMSTAMDFMNLSKISKSLELLFAAYKKTGSMDMGKYDIVKEGVDRINELYGDLGNSEKANVDEIVKKIESITPA